MKARLAICMLVFVLVLPPVASAAVKVWDGGGADANWMTNENWVGDVAPVPNEDSLEFPEGAARKSNSNNFPAGSLFLGIHFSGATGGYVLSGNLLVLGGTVTSANTSGANTISFPISTSMNGLGLTAVHASGTLVTTGIIALNPRSGPALSIGGAGNIHIAGVLQSTGSVTKSGAGAAILTASNTYTGSTIVLDGTLIVNGVQTGSPITLAGGTLGGMGTVGAISASSGTVSPGASPGVLNARNTTLSSTTSFRAELNGSSSGNGYDQLDVVGTVNLNGAILNATLGFVPANGAQFLIINNDGSDAVAGTFADLPQGSSLMIGSRSFTISYIGGTGNDVTLMAGAISYIAGTVTNAMTGVPVSGVSIGIYSNTGSFFASTSTNAQGVYTSPALPSGLYFVTAQPPSSSGLLGQLYNNLPCHNGNCEETNGTPVAVTAPSGTPNINFALPAGATITGTVTNAMTGAPVASVVVRVYSSTGSFLTSAPTNAQGIYATSIGLTTGSYFLSAVPPSSSGLLARLYNNLPCHNGNCDETNGTPVAVMAPNATTINFALPVGGTITGTVTNAMTGAPVSFTSMSVYSSTGFVASASTNAQGVYTTSTGLQTGTYFVTARPQSSSGLLGQLYNNLPCPDGNCNATSGTPVAVTESNTTVINFALPVGAKITGTVTSAMTGAPAPSTSVSIYSSTGAFVDSASTNAQGVYTTTTALPSGSYFVRALPLFSSGLLGQLYNNLLCHNGSCSVTSGTPVLVTAPNATTINFALPVGATITGTVTNATTSAPVANLLVEFFDSTGESIGSRITDAQGFYTSPTLISGSYYVLTEPASITGLVGQLYSNVSCPGEYCSVLSGTAVVATAPNPTPNINFALVQAPPAPNDEFATATVINSVPYQSIVNTTNATNGTEGVLVPCGNGSTQRSVWYLYTPTVNGPLAVNTFGSSYDTILAIFNILPGGWTVAGCNDQAGSSQSALTIQGTAGQQLAILVTSYSSSGGLLVLNVAGVPGAFGKISPANGTTTGPSAVTLSWGTSTDAQSYEYCVDPNNSSFCDSGWVPVGNVTSVGLTKLLPNTQYYWHVRALNVGATTYAEGSPSAFWSFTTRRSTSVELNGDALRDVFVHNMATGEWQRQIAQADGSFATAAGGWSAGWRVVPAIFDADALTDFFLFNTTSGQWLKVLSSAIGFTVQASGSWWPGWERYVMDLDGDGLSDLFLYDPATGTWFKALSTPTGFAYGQGAWNPEWEIYPMRLDDDAFGDMLLINRTTGRWFWVLGAAGAGFSYPASDTWFPGWELYPGDFNGDGLSDLFLFSQAAGQYYVAFNNGAGFTYAAGYGWAAGWTPYAADFDADGKDDLFLHNPDTGAWFQMISDGAGNFMNVGGQQWAPGWDLYLSDFNADARADILLYDPASGVWYQARNLVNGTFSYTTGTWAPGLTVITRAPIR